MSTPVANNAAAAPAAAPAPARGQDLLASKVQKHIDGLYAKLAKKDEENAALRAKLAAKNAAGSRISRIPKKPAAAEATTA